MDRTSKSRLFQSLKAVRRRKGKIGAVFLLGIFALMVIGSLSVPVSGNEVSLSYSPIEPVKNFQIAASEEIWIDTFGNDINNGWTLTGADPYLAAQDQPINEVSVTSSGGGGSSLGYFLFGSTSLTSITDVNISIYHNTAENTRITIYNSTYSETINLGNSGGGWAWETITAGATDELEVFFPTDTEINAAYIEINAKSQGGAGLVTIDAAKMGIEGSSGGVPYEKDLLETVSAVDVLTTAADYDRTYTESVAVADVRVFDVFKNMIETIGVIGVLAKTFGFNRTETISVVDTIETQKFISKNMTETISVIDSWSRSVNYSRDWTESITVVDTWSKTFGLNRSETISVVDTIDAQKLILKNMTETISVIDSWSRSVNYSRDWTESITVVDVKAVDVFKNLVESIGVVDVRALSVGRNFVESITVVDIIDAGIVGLISKNLIENITVIQVLGTEGGTPVTYSLFYELFFSLDMWGYLGPIGLVIAGYVATNKERILGVLFFVVQCLFISQYLTLVETTPAYWWHVFILLFGSMLTIVYSAWDRR